MTPRDILARLFESAKGVNPPRIAKAKALAERSGLTWTEILAAMTDAERAQVQG